MQSPVVMFLNQVRKWWPLVAAGAGVFVWVSVAFANIVAAAHTLNDHEKRIAAVEGNLAHLPAIDQHLADMQAQLNRIEARP